MTGTSPLTILSGFVRTRNWFNPAVFFLWCFSIYSEIPLGIGATKSIPSITLILLLPLVYSRIKEVFTLRHLAFFLSILGIALLSLLPQFSNIIFASVLIRVLQFSYSVLLGVITLVYVQSLPASTVKLVVGFFCVFIFFGCLLERAGLLTPITHAYRAVYTSTAYGGDIDPDREINLGGFQRPFFFTSEPSLVGLGFFCFSSAYSIMNTNKIISFLLLIANLVMVVLLGSPTILLSVILWVLILLSKMRIEPFKVMLVLLAFVFLVYFFFTSSLGQDSLGFVFSRFSEEIFTEGSSMYARLYIPYTQTIPTVLKHYPLLGVGFGNNELQKSLFGYKGFLDEYELQFVFGANAFGSMVANIGLLGIALLCCSVYWLQRTLRVNYFIIIICFLFFQTQIIGTFVTPRLWCNLAIFIGCCFTARKLEAAASRRPIATAMVDSNAAPALTASS